LSLRVDNQKQNIPFKKLYATKEARESFAFKEVEDFLKTQALKNDLFVQIIEEQDENKVPTRKFLVMAKDLTEDFVGKTKTRFLNSEHLKKAAVGAVKIMENKKQQGYAEELSQDAKDFLGNAYKDLDDIFGRFHKK
jgi:hypothetical protein